MNFSRRVSDHLVRFQRQFRKKIVLGQRNYEIKVESLKNLAPDPPSSGHIFDHGHRSGRKKLDQGADSGDLVVQRQATWGMSVE